MNRGHKMKKLFVIIISLSLPTVVFAEAKYLECSYRDGDKPKKVDTITIDESTENITHQMANGSFKAKGFFTPTEISYFMTLSPGIKQVYVINRVDLGFSSHWEMDSRIIPSKIKGTCKIIEMKKTQI